MSTLAWELTARKDNPWDHWRLHKKAGSDSGLELGPIQPKMKKSNFSNGEEASSIAKSTKIIKSPILQGAIGDTPTEEQMEMVNIDPGATDFQKLGAHIGHLVAMLADGKRRSIHQPMRDTIDSIRAHYELAAIQQKDEGAKEVLKAHCASQTSPLLRTIKLVKRKQGEEETANPTPKRKQKAQREAKETPKGTQTPTGGKKEGEWQKVSKKKDSRAAKEKRKRPERPRPDAVVIQMDAGSGSSYAEVLRRVKTDQNLKAIADSVTRVRRTQKGDLLLQLKETGDKAAEITKKIGEVLGQETTVKMLVRRSVVEIKDIDEVTTKQEIGEALNGLLGEEIVTEADVVSLRQAFGGTQAATVTLPAHRSRALLDIGKVKIGWSVCRLRERTTLTKCFKCLGFGHISKHCKSEVDRSKLCRNCGEEGHIAKDCKKQASCMFCKGDNPQQANHVAGSSKCPVFRRALSQKSR